MLVVQPARGQERIEGLGQLQPLPIVPESKMYSSCQLLQCTIKINLLLYSETDLSLLPRPWVPRVMRGPGGKTLLMENITNFFPIWGYFGLLWVKCSIWKISFSSLALPQGDIWVYEGLMWPRGSWGRKLQIIMGFWLSAGIHCSLPWGGWSEP